MFRKQRESETGGEMHHGLRGGGRPCLVLVLFFSNHRQHFFICNIMFCPTLFIHLLTSLYIIIYYRVIITVMMIPMKINGNNNDDDDDWTPLDVRTCLGRHRNKKKKKKKKKKMM